MRKPSNYIYYIGGALCLVLSVFLLMQSNVSPISLTNRVYFNNTDKSYRNYYYSAVPLHRNDLRQAAAYLPIYSITEEQDLWRFLVSFKMEQAEITNNQDYFLAQKDGLTLKVYKFLDLVEYTADTANKTQTNLIDVIEASRIAKDFVNEHLFLKNPFESTVDRIEDGIIVTFIENLGKIPNKAFPTIIIMDNYGNITSAEHFYFEYEEILRADLITPHTAISLLPRNHIGKIRINNYELIYIFENSILQPTYIFTGQYVDGSEFTADVPALNFN